MTMQGNVRRRDRKEVERDIVRRAALREFGERHAYAILFGPAIARAAGLALLAVGAAWVWFNVDHRTIGFTSAAVGIAFVLAYAASTIAATGPQRRMMARATGQRTRPIWWHGVGAAGVLLLALAYVALPF
jgi:hypothetical protein